MRRSPQPPAVPLEAGRGPDNPPCPACGEPLFGWIPGDEEAGRPRVRRCESCGLGVVGDEPGEVADALAALDRIRSGQKLRFANRAGFAAWLGGDGWAAIGPSSRYLFTPEALRRLLADRDQRVRVRWRPLASIGLMWQTILNGFTFGRNVGGAMAGRADGDPARAGWQRGLDAVVSVLAAIPALLAALPLELAAGALGRGGALAGEIEAP